MQVRTARFDLIINKVALSLFDNYSKKKKIESQVHLNTFLGDYAVYPIV